MAKSVQAQHLKKGDGIILNGDIYLVKHIETGPLAGDMTKMKLHCLGTAKPHGKPISEYETYPWQHIEIYGRK